MYDGQSSTRMHPERDTMCTTQYRPSDCIRACPTFPTVRTQRGRHENFLNAHIKKQHMEASKQNNKQATTTMAQPRSGGSGADRLLLIILEHRCLLLSTAFKGIAALVLIVCTAVASIMEEEIAPDPSWYEDGPAAPGADGGMSLNTDGLENEDAESEITEKATGSGTSSKRRERRSSSSKKKQKKTRRPGKAPIDVGTESCSRAITPIETGVSSSPSGASTAVRPSPSRYSLRDLVKTLGNEKDTRELSPELERRVLDFRLAQSKRRDKHGEQSRFGIFGMYAHLSDVRIDLEWSEDAAWRRRNGHPYVSWSDFDAARNKGASNRPWFTYFVVFLCTIMLIVEFGLNDWVVEPLSVNPLVGPSAEAMVDAGARVTPLIVEGGQWFRIFSPLFLHAGIIHYFINMAALWFIGGAVEQSHGIVNAMILFFIPGIGGNILSAIFLPQYISVGASGGIFGLVGGCISDIVMNWQLLFIKTGENDTKTKRRNIGSIMWLAAEIVVNLIIGFTPYVDNFSHLGGLVYGIGCGLSAIEPLPVGFFGVHSSTVEKVRAVLIRFLGLIVSFVLIIATTAILATMDPTQTFCSSCRYLSCVPFPPWKNDSKWWYCDDCDFVSAQLYKNPDGDDYYDLVELTCPNGAIEEIQILDEYYSKPDEIGQKLPAYCRQYCEEVTA